jgi:hypothetical protein
VEVHHEPPVRKRGLELKVLFCWGTNNPPDCELLLGVKNVGLPDGALIEGWLVCNGAGLGEWENSTQPPRKLNTAAMVIQTRMPFLTIFICPAFPSFDY